MYQIDVSQYIVWYYLLSALILALTFFASYKHKTAIPFMWGLILSIVLIVFASVLEPILFGAFYYYNTNWYMFALTGLFTLFWALLMTICLWNNVKYGSPVE
jgi:hypothetical protein